MKAVELKGFGGPEVLQLGTRPDPIPGEGELLIRVGASGINRPDVLQRLGHYAPPPGASDLPGLEVAGTVIAGDLQAMAQAGFAVGDRVCALVAGGGYAELCVAPVAQCLPIPAGWSDVEAASLPETFFTVWSNVFDRGRLQKGETLLIQGGTSGIGVTAIQLAKAFGAKVFVTAGSDEKCAAALSVGADQAINYKTTDFVQAVKDLTQGHGVDVILDMVAGPYVAREIDCLAEDGVEAGFIAGALLRKRLTVTGSTLRPRSVAFKADIAQSLKTKVWPLLSQGQIKPQVHSTFPAAQANASHALMESGQHVGKIVLTW